MYSILHVFYFLMKNGGNTNGRHHSKSSYEGCKGNRKGRCAAHHLDCPQARKQVKTSKIQEVQTMSANVETMFSVRETPWHGLGRIVMDAPASREALELAGLNWQVESRNI